MIDKIVINNFKSIEDVKIDLAPVATIFIGPNSSGKSSILQAIALMKNSLIQPTTANLTNLGFLQMGEIRELIHCHDLKRKIVISAHVILDDVRGSYEVTLSPNSANCNLKLEEPKLSLSFVKTSHARSPAIASVTIESKIVRVTWDGSWSLTTSPPHPLADRLQDILKFLSTIFFVPIHRGFGVPQYTRASIDPRKVIALPAHYIAIAMETNADVEETVSYTLETAVGTPVRAKSLASAVRVISRHRWIGTDVVNEGFGLNQATYMMGTISSVPPKSTILIEEPEIHLHPRAQYVLMQELLEYAKEHIKQLVVTTHSEHILTGTLRTIGKKLTPEDIKIYYLERTKDLKTQASLMRIHEDGSVEGGLKGFFEQDFIELRDLLGALSRK